ncbi:MAG: hypothetical protein Q4D91_13205 [Lautropia sp.]|nr:hypothetical protein [Lautropia sp.]
MKPFQWSVEKNHRLRQERGVSFEDVVVAIESGRLLDVVEHPNKARYPDQQIMVVDLFGYAYLVPFVEESEYLFLKTLIPSRKATRDFLGKRDTDD